MLITNLSFIGIRTKVIHVLKKLGFSPIDFIYSINNNSGSFRSCKEGYLIENHLDINIKQYR